MMMNSIGLYFRQYECDKRLVCKYQCGLLDEMVARTSKLRDSDSKINSQILDISFRDLVKDPIAVVSCKKARLALLQLMLPTTRPVVCEPTTLATSLCPAVLWLTITALT